MKLLVLIVFILSVSLIRTPSLLQIGLVLFALLLLALAAHLPIGSIFVRTLLVVPFVGPFAAMVFLSGDHVRTWAILSKAYVSASAVLLVASTTMFSKLLAAARWYRLPEMLVEVTQLIYRYLFVLAAEVREMRVAAAARSGAAGRGAFIAAAGGIAVLFERSYRRAEFTHQAMLSRGFSGAFPAVSYPALRPADYLAGLFGLLYSVGLHLVSR